MCFFFLKIDPCLWISEKDAKIVSDYFPILMDSVLPIFVSNSEKKNLNWFLSSKISEPI